MSRWISCRWIACRWIAASCFVVLPLLAQPAQTPPAATPPAADKPAPSDPKPAAKPDKNTKPGPKGNNNSLPTKIDDLNAQPEYKVGVGDGLFISVWKEPEVTSEVQVRGDCRITLNLVKDLEVCGLTPTQIQDLVTDKLSKFIAAPDVTVTYKVNNSRKVFMIGQVRRPGGMVLNGPLTIADALSDAGGLSEYANDKKVVILHADGTQTIFNYRDYLKGKSTSGNVLLQPGDRVIVH